MNNEDSGDARCVWQHTPNPLRIAASEVSE
jgi:hypothetical protein